MKKLLSTFILTTLLVIGCSPTENTQKETEKAPTEVPQEPVVVATLNNTEITTHDILTQYPLEDKYIDIYVKEEIIMLEAKEQGIEVTKEDVYDIKNVYYPNYADEPEKEFFESKAKLLNMTPEEYFELWTVKYITRDIYLQEYLKKNFEAPTSDEEAAKWRADIDAHIEELLTIYKEEGKLEMSN